MAELLLALLVVLAVAHLAVTVWTTRWGMKAAATMEGHVDRLDPDLVAAAAAELGTGSPEIRIPCVVSGAGVDDEARAPSHQVVLEDDGTAAFVSEPILYARFEVVAVEVESTPSGPPMAEVLGVRPLWKADPDGRDIEYKEVDALPMAFHPVPAFLTHPPEEAPRRRLFQLTEPVELAAGDQLAVVVGHGGGPTQVQLVAHVLTGAAMAARR